LALQKASTSRPNAPTLVNMSPDAFTFGLIDDVDIEITDAICATAAQAENYNSDDTEAPLFIVEMTGVNGDQHTQFYSLGKSEDWAPSANGEGFVSVSGKTSINATTNLGMFLKSLVENGFPADVLATGNLKSIIGTKAHVLMKQTDRKSLVRAGRDPGKPTGVLLVSKIHSLPGADTKGAKAGIAGTGKAAAAGATKAATGGKVNGAAKSGDEFEAIDAGLIEGLTEVLAEKDTLALKDVMKIAVAKFTGNDKSKAIKRSRDMEFLNQFKGEGNEGIKFDGSEFSLA
jgi:hypothetical protein